MTGRHVLVVRAALVHRRAIVLVVRLGDANDERARGGVARVGQLQLLQPFITLVIAALFLGETIDAEMVVFAAAIVIVVALGRRAAIRQRG